MPHGILRENHVQCEPDHLLICYGTRLVELLNMVSSAQKWPIQSVQIPNTWSSPSGNLVLIGDAAHAMLPNMSQGKSVETPVRKTGKTYRRVRSGDGCGRCCSAS